MIAVVSSCVIVVVGSYLGSCSTAVVGSLTVDAVDSLIVVDDLSVANSFVANCYCEDYRDSHLDSHLYRNYSLDCHPFLLAAHPVL